MLPFVVFHVEPADEVAKLYVALLIPRAVSGAQLVWFNGLQEVQVCAAAGAGAVRAVRSPRYRMSDIFAVICSSNE